MTSQDARYDDVTVTGLEARDDLDTDSDTPISDSQTVDGEPVLLPVDPEPVAEDSVAEDSVAEDSVAEDSVAEDSVDAESVRTYSEPADPDLADADRSDSEPTDSDLTGSDLTGSDLTGSDLTDSEPTDSVPPVATDDSPSAASAASAAKSDSDWQDLQGRFVDDPAAAVREAGAWVEQALADLRGRVETGSTEDLRTAFRRYRELHSSLD
jgi:Pentapeptide repeats (8 copies)